MTIQSALIIGGGAIGVDHHLPRLRDILGCQSTEIYEPNPKRVQQLQRDFGGDRDVTVGSDLPERNYDLVVIATPPKFHFDYCRKFVKHCDSCIIEKPMAMTLEQCNAILDIACSGGGRVFVPMIRRTLPGYALLKQLLTNKTFGDLERITVTEGGVFSWGAVSVGSFSRDLNGGGVLMDTGPHTLDLLLQIFNSLRCEAAYMDGFAPAVEANCELRLIADDRVPVALSLSRNRNLSSQLIFNFSDVTARIGIRSSRIHVEHRNGTSYSMVPESVTEYTDPAFAALFDAWYREFVLRGINAGVGPEEAAKIAAVIDAAYACAQPIEGGF